MSSIRKFPKRGTIGYIVLTALAKNPEVDCKTLTKAILKKFQDSAFGPSHLAWYKYQVAKGNYVLPVEEPVQQS